MGPNPRLALQKYRHRAATYDRRVARAESVRRRAAARLHLKPGAVVLDVACGTGLSFPLIEEGIGQEGQLIGIDLSPEMLSEARQRVEANGWQNVMLVESAIEDAEIPAQADAVLFFLTHDVMRSPRALENVFRHVKTGARVVAAGGKRAPWWALPANIYVWHITRQYATTHEGLGRPWSHLERFVRDLRVESTFFGFGYIASGVAVPR